MEIQNYPNYLIYPDGRVWSKKRIRTKGGFLSKNNKVKMSNIHRLIGIHYIPNPENKKNIDHIDGDKLNNNIDNLRWVSSIENCNYFKSQKSNNTSGHKCINWSKQRQEWRYQKIIFGKRYGKNFKTKQEAIIYKFIFLKFLSK